MRIKAHTTARATLVALCLASAAGADPLARMNTGAHEAAMKLR